jgi:DNA repair protein SbcD/Mre11
VPQKDFCFVHAADLHLDTPFEGVRADAPDVAEALADASLAALDALVDLALERQAAFVVIAGDVYDGPERGVRAQLRFRRGLGTLAEAGIPVLVAHGNHDPVETGWSAIREWPPGVVVFPSGEVLETEIRRDGAVLARVQGISYPRREVPESLVPRFAKPAGGGLSVGVLHCNVGSSPGHAEYSPCTLADLGEVGLGYWALGHVHRHAVLAGGAGEQWVVYPGNTQGRSVHPVERGAKGAVVVDVAGGSVTAATHVPCDSVRFEQVNVSIAEVRDVAEVCELLAATGESRLAEAEGRSLVLRAVLTGRGRAHSALTRPGATEAVLRELRSEADSGTPFLWWTSVLDATNPTLERASIRGRGDFCADVVALSDRLAGDDTQLELLFEKAGDDQMPLALRDLARTVPLGPLERQALLDEATDRALDLLGVMGE